jgi:GMP synthase-like glutamine amidotransferase
MCGISKTIPGSSPRRKRSAAGCARLKRPLLGVCLGHQLIADSLGGTCGPQRPAEIGILDIELTEAGRSDPIFAGMASSQKCLQWHSVRVAQPPEEAVVLASSGLCSCQAMRIGKNVYSMQYHVELEPDTIANWGRVPAYAEALAKRGAERPRRDGQAGGGADAQLRRRCEAALSQFHVDRPRLKAAIAAMMRIQLRMPW